MVRHTSLIAAAAGTTRASGTRQAALGPGITSPLSRAGSPGFSQILSEVLMTRQDRPQAAGGTRQEFPRPLRNSGDAHLSRMMLRSALGRGSGRGLNPSASRSSSGSEESRLFNSVKSRGRAVDPKAFESMIKNASVRHQVPEELVKAVIKVESNFNPQATSHMGAMGLMQLMPGTARDLGVTRPYDPGQNINGGTKYLRELLDRYDGDVPKAVAAYNCGPGNVERGRLPQETRSYLKLVSQHYSGSQNLRKGRYVPAPPAPKAASVEVSPAPREAAPASKEVTTTQT
ncbi:MAG: lytic transglycosylase domain-containing protein [Deltaproteobacteria bacterium]|nr:MAG: lytic transglycosylase domain-containing protein [Deltaproteobacteria bacterium]